MAEIGTEELKKLEEIFGEWGISTKMTSLEDLKTLLTVKPEVKQEVKPEVKQEEQTVHSRSKGRDMVPKLPIFTGGKESQATPFELWKHDVDWLRKQYAEEIVLESVRRSLKGEAALVMVRLGTDLNIRLLLHKFEVLYGTVDSESALLTTFYAAEQEPEEDVKTWCCRLEGLLQRVEEQGLISSTAKNEMLRTKLWTGLANTELKQSTRHSFDNLKDVHQLVIKLRTVEMELGHGDKKEKTEKKKIKNQAIQNTENTTQTMLKQLSDRLGRMEEDIKHVKTKQEQQQEQQQDSSSKEESHRWNKQRNDRGRGRSRGRGRGRGQEYRPTEGKEDEDKPREEIVCYKCGQIGHIALGCRVRTDHMRHLNDELPLPGGGQ